MPRRLSDASRAAASWLLALLGLAAALEAVAGGLLWRAAHGGDAAIWWAAGTAHLLSAGVLLAFRRRPEQFPGAGHWHPKFCGLMTLFLPGVGLLGCITILTVSRLVLKTQGLAKEFDENAYRVVSMDEFQLESDLSGFFEEELSTQPIVDVLNGDDVEAKRGAISLMRRMKTPATIALLKRCLSETDVEIRFYAHTAISRIEADMTQEIEQAERRAGGGRPEALRAVSRIYRDYARSGLPEQSMRDYYLRLARLALERVAAAQPSAGLDLELGVICLEQGDFAEAETCFRRALEDPERRREAELGLCRVQFERRDFRALRELTGAMRPLADAGTAPEAVYALYNFWAEGDRLGADAAEVR